MTAETTGHRPDHVTADLVRDVDHVFGPDFLRDPFAAFRDLRDARVLWSPRHGGYWILTRVTDIRAAMQRPGAGPHRCAGSHLARDELRTALRQWHARIPDYRIDRSAAAGPPTIHAGGAMGLDRLPLRWDTP